jgi:potassium-dependent mechanosensitive channel
MTEGEDLITTMLKFTTRLALAIVFFSLAGFTSTNGQATTAVPATNAAATNAPSATPPVTPIALGDVVAQAQSLTTKLAEIQNGLTTDQTQSVIAENLPNLTQQIDQRTADDIKLLDATPSLSILQSSQASWQSLADNLATSQDALSQRAKHIDSLMSQLNQWKAIWQATLDATKKPGALPEAAQPVSAVLAALADTIKATQAAQATLFSIQAELAKQAARVTTGTDLITKAEKTARTQLLEQDHPPLWRAEAVSSAGAGIVAQEKVSLQTQLQALQTYLADKEPALLIHLLIFVLLVIGLHWIRNVIKSHTAEEAALHHAARVFDVPPATALLLALLATGLLYPLAPRLLWAIVGAIALIPAIIIIRRLIEPELLPILYATVFAYFFDQLRYVVMPAGILSRFLFIFELLAASIFLLIVLRAKHLADSQQTSRLKWIARIYLHVTFFVLLFAGFANVSGFVPLSILVGNGMLKSSYLAVIFYAAVRIADAMVISALSIRPFTRLRMVRRYRDLLYNNLGTYIRWLAFALWVVAALQLFSLRDPLWQEADRLLKTRLPWFSLNFPIGNILAFPITVWAAFLLSRFIRFALEEEVYPHLQLGRGIPYAASTMVHYVILVLGFFAALAAAKVDLSQFTILAGAFGVGLGFGLQNIMNNFVSGVILLFERPIKVGDIIQIDTNVGTVERIGIRASVIRLTNGSELIVPNGNLISNPVTNWTLSNCERLIEIPVNIASKVDPQHVINILSEAVRAHPDVLKNPSPQALLVTFGATTLSFRVRAWIDSEEEWMKITSDLSLAINSALAKENIAMS